MVLQLTDLYMVNILIYNKRFVFYTLKALPFGKHGQNCFSLPPVLQRVHFTILCIMASILSATSAAMCLPSCGPQCTMNQ